MRQSTKKENKREKWEGKIKSSETFEVSSALALTISITHPDAVVRVRVELLTVCVIT